MIDKHTKEFRPNKQISGWIHEPCVINLSCKTYEGYNIIFVTIMNSILSAVNCHNKIIRERGGGGTISASEHGQMMMMMAMVLVMIFFEYIY